MTISLGFISVWAYLRSKGRYVGRLLLREKMPVWLVLFGILIGSLVTYLVAPVLNSKFEVAKARAAYVTENLKGLNTDTANLFADLASVAMEVSTNQEISTTTRSELIKAVVILQWRANEYEVLFPDEASLTTIRRYSAGIDAVRQLVTGTKPLPTTSEIREAAAKLASETRGMIVLLSRKSEWSRTFTVL